MDNVANTDDSCVSNISNSNTMGNSSTYNGWVYSTVASLSKLVLVLLQLLSVVHSLPDWEVYCRCIFPAAALLLISGELSGEDAEPHTQGVSGGASEVVVQHVPGVDTAYSPVAGDTTNTW